MELQKFNPSGWKSQLGLGKHSRAFTQEELAEMNADYLAEKRADGAADAREEARSSKRILIGE